MLREKEPDLDPRYTLGLFVAEAGSCCRDPGAYVEALARHAQSLGASLVRARAVGFRVEAGRLRAVATQDGGIARDAAAISARAHSAGLAASVGPAVPLESARG
jgi:D-amino-acid dehydrogenase